MPNTATVYARIDPELKSDVDKILNTLGVTPSSLIQMLYCQIKLTKSIPFNINIPNNDINMPINIDNISQSQFNEELAKGLNCNKTFTADEVAMILKEKFGE